MGDDPLDPGTRPARTPVRRRTREKSARALIDAVFPAPDDAAALDDSPSSAWRTTRGETTKSSSSTPPVRPGEAAPRPLARPSPMPVDDLQLVCQEALHSTCEALGLDVGLVLQRDESGNETRPLASFAKVGVPRTPEHRELALLWRQLRAIDLGEPTLPEIARLFSQRTGFTAVRALSPSKGLAAPGLVLLVGGASDPLGRVRPRTLARLDALASGLGAPLERARTVTRIGELDDAVKRLDRLALLGSLVAEVIHEVRNPLVSIKTFLELLPDRLDDPEFHDSFRGLVLDEVFRLERLLDEVLAHARPGPVGERPEDADVSEAIAAIEQLLAHRAREAGVTLTGETVAHGFGAAALSPDALRQVLLNLCVNAIEACRGGGVVRITARRRNGAGGADHAEIWVEDDGPGIAEADRELVFEPFHSNRNDAPGGLGLAISRRLAEDAGGRLFVAQATEGGARFVLRLPFAR
jgi:signal transduction histidine kinase